MNFLDMIKNLRQKFVDMWEKTEKKDRFRFFLIAGVTLVVIFAAVALLTKTNYTVLATEMDTESSVQVAQALSDANIPYRKSEGGAVISVPEKQAESASVLLTSLGLPKTGKNYELFEKGAGLITSDYEKRKYEQYNTEDNLARTIRGNLEPVADAVVMLGIPEQSPVIFSSKDSKTTASVWLTLKSGASADEALVTTVQRLVSGAVPDLEPEDVSVTDQYGALLSYNKEDLYTKISNNREIEKQAARDLETAAMSILGPMVGYDHAKVSANVTINFDTKETHNTFFSPVVDDEGIPISTQTTYEEAYGRYGTYGQPGIDDNGGADTYTEGEGNDLSSYKKTTETTNSEVNKTEEVINSLGGEITNATISVVIDSNGLSEINNDSDMIRSLVAGAIGLDRVDYNKITVAIAPLDGNAEIANKLIQIREEEWRAQLFELIKVIALYVIIAFCLLLLALRTLALFRNRSTGVREEAIGAIAGIDAEIDEYGELVKLATSAEQIEVVKSPARERVEEFVENNPDAVANLLRNWLSDE